MVARRVARIGMLVLLGCRTPESSVEPPAEAITEPSPVSTTPTPANGEAPTREPTSDPPVAPTLAPVAMAATVPATPFAKDAVVVRMLSEAAPVTLFADEREQMRAAIAATLTKAGHPVVPVADLARIERAAAKGVLELEGGQTCRAALTRFEVEHRYFREHRIAIAGAACFEGCQLDVRVEAPAGAPDPGLTWERKGVRKPEDPRSWITAAKRLRSVDEGLGFGLIGGGAGGGPDMQFLQPHTIGPWKGQPPDAAFTAAEPELAACKVPSLRQHSQHDVRAAVTPAGTIARCETELAIPHALAGPDHGACICDVLRQVRLPPAAAGRRFRIDVLQRGEPSSSDVNVVLAPLQTDTDDWIERFRRSDVLDRCVTSARPDATVRATIAVPLAEDGAVGDVRIAGDIVTHGNAAFAGCLIRELARVDLPCRPPGLTELRVRMDVTMRVH